MSLTILDVIVIVVVLISAILAMVRGFVREVLSIASWIAAVAAAYYLYKPLVPVVKPYVESTTVQLIVAAAAVFFVALIVATYVTMKISDLVIDSRIGALDRALGFLFGAARGVLLLVIALLFFNWLVQPPPTWVANAQTKPLLDNLGEQLMARLPDDVEATIVKRFRGGEDDEGGEATSPPDGGEAANPDDPAYDGGQRQGIDRLIENSSGGTGGN